MTDSDSTTDDRAAAEDSDPSYSYKSNLAGAPLMLWLRRDGMEWNLGRRSGVIRYDRIRRVRLSYRPATLQSYRFTTEIWSGDAPKLQIASTSWQGMMVQQRLDAAYAAFIVELHRRLGAAGSTAVLHAGMAKAGYVVGLAAVGGSFVAFAVLLVKAALLAEWRAVAIIGVICAVFGWQLGGYFVRNRPADYRPDAVPPRVLPRA